MHSLPLFLKLEGRRVLLLGDGPAAEAKARLLDRAGAVIDREPDDQVPYALAVVVLEDRAAAEEAVAALRARNILVNATDRPDLCDFTLPAIVDRDPVIIAIGTGGSSAGLAKMLRQRIEAMLPASLGRLAQALFGARLAMKAKWPGAADRRRAIDLALAPGGLLDPLEDHESCDVDDWLAAEGAVQPARIETIELASPDPDDLTLRAARLLGLADRVCHHPDVPAAILNRARADADRVAMTAAPDDAADGLTLWVTPAR